LFAAALVLALPVSMARGAPAGQNRLSVGSVLGASGATVAVPLDLANEDAVSGIQIDILFDPAVAGFLDGAIATRATGMVFSPSLPSPGRLRLVMYFGGGGAIPAGAGAVANLNFQLVGAAGTTTALTPAAPELSDRDAVSLPVTAAAGYVTVTGGGDPTGACCATDGACSLAMQAACTAGTWRGENTVCVPNPCPPPPTTETLSIGTASGRSGAPVTVPLNLHNTQPISGIQLEILVDSTVVSFTSAAITSRANGMSIRTSALSAGRLLVVMYFGGGGSISAGDGAVANLTFQVIGAEGTASDLTPDAAILSDPNAQELPVTASAGHITVTGGGDPTGACCAPAGTCTVVTQAGCTAGIWQGLGTSCTPNLCPPAQAADTLSVGNGSGASGTEVTVLLNLRNTQPVKGLQLDIRFAESVVSWVGGTVALRAGGMAFADGAQGTGGVRILMYYADSTTLAPGTGAIANLVFRLGGAGGTSSPLTLSGVEVADPESQPITVFTRDGRLDVTGGPGDPTGACCATYGACTLVTQVACTAGTWRGADTTCVPNPCPPPPPADTLAAGSGSGSFGGQITIPLGLANHVAVRGIQADLLIDPAVLRFESGSAASRVGSMRFEASSPTPNRVRILMYYDDGSTFAAGRGSVANLVFTITGSAGSRSSLTPADIVIADMHNQEIPTVGSAGEVTVIGGAGPPDLRLAVLKNPGRTRTLQIFVLSDVELDAPPIVGLSVGISVPVTQLPGPSLNLFQGSVSVDDATAGVTVQATGMHGGVTGTAQTTVTF
jgi:hypothetical protein